MLTPELKLTLLGNEEEAPPESASDAAVTEKMRQNGTKKGESEQSSDTPKKEEEKGVLGNLFGRKRRADSSLPKEFDSRKAWPDCAKIIGQVDDQSLCASCWAISLTHVLSDRFCIASVKAGKGPTNFFLSTTQVISCINPKKNGCEPGKAKQAWVWIAKNGVVTGGPHGNNDSCQSYPFPALGATNAQKHFNKKQKAPSCQNSCHDAYTTPFKEDKHFAKETTTLKGPGNVEKMMQEIMTNGPVQASLRVYADLFQYAKGVYKHVTGDYVGGHTVRIIGWGEEKDTKYWIAGNSWNSDWGEEGFFRIIRGEDSCNLETWSIDFAAAKL